jgi:hypothetical protein
MAGTKLFDRIILAVLIAGAIVFVLLLAGAGSSVFTNPTPYVVPTP